jgi:hypothetical protein
MIDFVSTLEGDRPTVEMCVVYDERDGRIVHTHGFIGDGTGMLAPAAEAQRAKAAFERAAHHHGADNLRVAHVPHGFRFQADAPYRFDVKAGELVSLSQPATSAAELVKRRRK